MDERKYETRRGTGRVKASTKSEKLGGVDAKSGKEMMPKRGNNNETSRPAAYEIHLYGRKGDRVECGGCVDQGRE